MGQTLTNGIYLPSEGERNCYAGLAANWNAVDTLKGSYSAHAINVEIHVTTAEKTLWNTVSDKANDADVVHKAGTETIGGNKTFTNVITNNITNKANAYITLKNSSYDPKTNGQSSTNTCSFSIGFYTLTDDAFAYISAYGTFEYSMLRLTTTYFTDSENSITDSIEYKIYQNGDRTLRPRNQNNCTLGETSRRWKDVNTFLINGINPGALFLPKDGSARVNISAYFSATASGNINTMTAPDDGFIFLLLTDVLEAHCLSQTANTLLNYGQTFARHNAGILYILFPIRKNDIFSCQWYTTATAVTVNNAFFIPCKGNI